MSKDEVAMGHKVIQQLFLFLLVARKFFLYCLIDGFFYGFAG
jgi:hypothetical protein